MGKCCSLKIWGLGPLPRCCDVASSRSRGPPIKLKSMSLVRGLAHHLATHKERERGLNQSRARLACPVQVAHSSDLIRHLDQAHAAQADAPASSACVARSQLLKQGELNPPCRAVGAGIPRTTTSEVSAALDARRHSARYLSPQARSPTL